MAAIDSVTHQVKCLPQYFEPIFEHRKFFEVRLNDRDYKVGDILELKEHCPFKGFTGRICHREITYILENPEYVKQGFVILSIFI